ncbi:PTS sugar transporter subunit IIA [Acidobacteriota bacterium]
MFGAVIVAHKGLAEGLLHAAEMILGSLEGIAVVSVELNDKPESLESKIRKAIQETGRSGEGVVLLTDMFGGTPTNIGMSFLEAGKVELVTGVNLPMLIKFLSHREEKDLEKLGKLLRTEGQRSIYLASEMLSGAVEF